MKTVANYGESIYNNFITAARYLNEKASYDGDGGDNADMLVDCVFQVFGGI